MISFTCTSLSPERLLEFAIHLEESIGKTPYELVVVSPVPVTGPNVRHIQEHGRIGNLPAHALSFANTVGDYIVALSPDTRFVDKNFGAILIDEVRRREAACFPFAGGMWMYMSQQIPTAYGLYYPSFPAVSRRSVDHVGGWFDPTYKVGWGDVDLGMRIWLAGGKCAPLETVRILEETRPEVGEASRFKFNGGSWEADFELFKSRYHHRLGRYFQKEFREINYNYDASYLNFERTFQHNLPPSVVLSHAKLCADASSAQGQPPAAIAAEKGPQCPQADVQPVPASKSAMSPKPLVIGAPRTGFSLLIQIVGGIEGSAEPAATPQPVVNKCVEMSSAYLTQLYTREFARKGITSDLIYNGEFHLLVGGPKWLDKQNPELASFRKYFGVRGSGDFLMTTTHPREVLDYYSVVHSHTAPALWPDHSHFGSYRRLASIRNPIGTVNSACFSLNAMASEYIQKFLPEADETYLRQRLALYKLTDLEFIAGLIRFLRGYLDEFLPVQERYAVMRWEDLITSPVSTIQAVGTALGRSVSPDMARGIWGPMDHVNTMEHHKHNFRQGKGIVGDWKNSLVQAHMDLFREHGFDRYLTALGYPPIPDLNPKDYSPFQRLVAEYIGRGEVYRSTGDADLFGFAFNKSNIDASKFNFKSFPKLSCTHVERSTVVDDALVTAVAEVADEGCSHVNRLIRRAIEIDADGSNQPAGLRDLTREWEQLWKPLLNDDPKMGRVWHRLETALQRCA